MALYDSQDLLARVKRLAARPAVDALMADADWYAFLTDGQAQLVPKLASCVPDAMLTVPTLLTSADSGLTYTFSGSQYPLGVTLYASTKDIPDCPLVLGVDYTWEGDVVRMAHGTARTFAAGPYAQYVPEMTTVIDGSTEPIVFPKMARRWLVAFALEQYAYRAGLDPEPYLAMQARLWSGDPRDRADVGIQGALKLAVRRVGRLQGGTAWWRTLG